MTPHPQKAPTTPVLTWLFKAEFADGYILNQDSDDMCYSPSKGRSPAFSCLLEAEAEHGKPTSFVLISETNDNWIGVDLKTGNFVINDVPFCAHNQFFEPSRYELELVYFRETRVQQDIKATVQDDQSLKQEYVGDPRHFVNRYFVGWKTVVNGQAKQVTLAVG